MKLVGQFTMPQNSWKTRELNSVLPILPERTVCECEACRKGCYEGPGYLIPTDLTAYKTRFGLDTAEKRLAWAEEHLLASPGAVVVKGGVMFRIPTLVPARQNGEQRTPCHFLTDGGRCSIHAVSPFGCRAYDSHMPASVGSDRSQIGMQLVLDDWKRAGEYSQTWTHLNDKGRVAPAPEENRGRRRII